MIKVVRGDITSQATDAIVNAANPSLVAGGGICGAIHRVAGPELERECSEVGGCPTGEARITGAYNLPCKYVIHAVAPRYRDGRSGESAVLIHCYKSIFALTEKHGIESISIPAIGTGIYGYPTTEATQIAFDVTVAVQEEQNLSVEFVCFDEDTANVYEQVHTKY